MVEIKIALLDRRFGSESGNIPNSWIIKKTNSNVSECARGENTFALIDAFGETMTGSIEMETEYNDLTEYDAIYMRVRNPVEELNAIKKIRETCPKTVMIAYTDEWVNFNTIEKMQKYKFKELSETVDAVVCGFGLNYSQEIFDKLEIKNYYHSPYAGDVGYWKQWYRPYSRKSNYIVGMWHLRSIFGQGRGDVQHETTFKVMNHLQKRFDVDCKFFLNFDGWKYEGIIREKMKELGINCELIKHIPNDADFNEVLSKARLFIEEYPSPSYSRATVVSACVGTPQISTYLNDPSRVCFPNLTVNYGETEKMYGLGRKLLENEQFNKKQVKIAQTNVEYYNYPQYKNRIIQLVNKLRK